MKSSKNSLIDEAVIAWKNAQVVFLSPSYNGLPEARALAEKISTHAEISDEVLNLLNHNNQLVSAYALISLKIMNLNDLENKVSSLLERKEMITTVYGSFREKIELGSFARKIFKD